MITNCGVGIVTDKLLPARHEHDFYETDLGTVERTLDKYRALPNSTRRCQYPRSILDPGAGSGNWGKIARDQFPLSSLTGCELRDVPRPVAYDYWLMGANYLSVYEGMPAAFDLVMGNPPFKLSEAFIRKSLPLLRPEGHLLFLLRLSFLEGQARRDGLFAEHQPKAVWVCSKRPSFQQDGKTNATAFAVFVWQKGWEGHTKIEWLK